MTDRAVVLWLCGLAALAAGSLVGLTALMAALDAPDAVAVGTVLGGTILVPVAVAAAAVARGWLDADRLLEFLPW